MGYGWWGVGWAGWKCIFVVLMRQLVKCCSSRFNSFCMGTGCFTNLEYGVLTPWVTEGSHKILCLVIVHNLGKCGGSSCNGWSIEIAGMKSSGALGPVPFGIRWVWPPNNCILGLMCYVLNLFALVQHNPRSDCWAKVCSFWGPLLGNFGAQNLIIS